MKKIISEASMENSLLTKTPNTSLGNMYKNILAHSYVGLLIIFLICLIKVEKGNAQGTASYFMANKNNHFIPVPVVASNSDFLLAGTDGDFEGRIRVMRVDQNGNFITGIIIDEPNHLKTVVDFTELNGVYYLTVLRRADPLVWNDKDMIEVIGMDDMCNQLSPNIDFSITTFCNNCTLTPIHTTAYNNRLYICGYSTQVIYPYGPLIDNFDSRKFGFVLYVDPINPATLLGQLFENQTQKNGGPYWTGTDYDMAVRVVPTSSGNIYVTGSSNVVRQQYPFPPIQAVFSSGMMNMLLDLNTLLPISGSTNIRPICKQFGNVNDGEYGQDMKEIGGYFFIAGNEFNANAPTFPDGKFYNFTAVNSGLPNQLIPVGGTIAPLYSTNSAHWQEAAFDYCWGLQTLPSHINSTDNIVLAGTAQFVTPSCTIHLPVNRDNYNQFTADYALSVIGTTINVNQNFINLYPSNVGTGLQTLPNSYNRTNRWTFNNTWAPNIAAQRSNSGDPLTLTAPYWNNPMNQLNPKFIIADEFGDANVGCLNTSVPCIPNYSYLSPVQLGLGPISVGSDNYTVQPYNYDLNFDPIVLPNSNWSNDPITSVFCDQNYWKPTIPILQEDVSYNFLPNPTQDNLEISLKGNSEKVKFWITDCFGRIVLNLYDGDATVLVNKFNVASLSSGLYFIHCIADNVELPIQKLTIN